MEQQQQQHPAEHGFVRSSRQSSTSDHPPHHQYPSSTSTYRYLYVLQVYRHVLLCLLFGSMSLVIGIALVTLSVVIRSRTSSHTLLESLPIYMPGLVLICNGTSMIAFMNSKTRRFYLLKSVFTLYLLVAILLSVVVVTQVSVHLPRIASNRSCVYNTQLRRCVCSTNILDENKSAALADDTGNSLISLALNISHSNPLQSSPTSPSKNNRPHQIVFESVSNCQNIHGIVYDSLRVVLALSSIGVLVCFFALLTLYRLHSHEYEKFYIEQQLRLRGETAENVQSKAQTFDSAGGHPQQPHHQSLHRHSTPANSNCLNSPNFSSCDRLIVDSTSNSDGGAMTKNVKNYFTSRDLLEDSRPRIWSSQSSGFVAASDARSENGKSTFQHKLRRVVSVMFDSKSSNSSKSQWSRFNLFRRKDSSGTNSSATRRQTRSQTLLPPPHASRLFALNNANQEYSATAHLGRFSGENLHHSFYLSSSTTSSFTSKISNLNCEVLSDPFPVDCAMQETNFNEPANPSLADDVVAIPMENSSRRLTEPSELEHWTRITEQEVQQMFVDEPNLQQPQLNQSQQQQQQFEHLVVPDILSPEQLSPTCLENLTPIVASEQIDDYFTTFEEAFKNYYDSQHRISEYQFHTLPLKNRTKRHPKRKFRPDDIKMQITSDDEFPPIEPPEDYQNIPSSSLNVQILQDPALPQQQQQPSLAVQPSDHWLYQFMAEMDQIQKQPLNLDPEFEDEYDDDMDEEDAGDTSTSQDIAEFELELDEESIKFDDDDESKESEQIYKVEKSNLTVIQAVTHDHPQKPVPLPQPILHNPLPILRPLPPPTLETHMSTSEHQQNLQQQPLPSVPMSTSFIEHQSSTAQNNEDEDDNQTTTDDDDDDDGDIDDDHESMEHESSVSGTTQDDEEESSSLTTGYIAPPTPFSYL